MTSGSEFVIPRLASHAGFKNWLVGFSADEVVWVPLGIGPSLTDGVRAGVSGGLGVELEEPHEGAALDALKLEAQRLGALASRPGAERVPVGEINRLTLRWCLMQCELRVEVRGRRRTYSFASRALVSPAIAGLSALYPARFAVEESAAYRFCRRTLRLPRWLLE